MVGQRSGTSARVYGGKDDLPGCRDRRHGLNGKSTGRPVSVGVLGKQRSYDVIRCSESIFTSTEVDA